MKLFEAKQKPLIVHNPADILMKYNMKPGDYVSIAYISEAIRTPENKSGDIALGKMYNINAETDAKLAAFIDELPENRLKQSLDAFRNSEKYQAFLNGTSKNKTGKIDLKSEHIIKVSHYTCNWKDIKGLAKFYDKQTTAEWNLRKEYGFEDGFDDPIDADIDPEAEPNWRDKYNGHNVMPRTKSNFNGNVYKEPTIIPGIYASLSDPNKVALRFAYNPKSSNTDSEYYYVNSDGTLFKLDRAFITFLTYAYKEVKEETQESVTPEEREFVYKLNALLNESPSIAELTLSCDKVLFLKSSARDSKNFKNANIIPFVWINTEAIMQTYDYIAPEEINKIIKNLVYSVDDTDINATITNVNVQGKSIADLVKYDTTGKASANPEEVRNRLGIAESLRALAKSYRNSNNTNKQLYESIMSNVSREIKKALDL